MKIGDKLEGTITGIQPYGAFVELESGVTGDSYLRDSKYVYVSNIHDILSIGEKVFVQVIDVDEYSKKASLSLRTLKKRRNKYSDTIVFRNITKWFILNSTGANLGQRKSILYANKKK